MSKNVLNLREYGDFSNAVYSGLLGSPAPTVPLPTAQPIGYYDVGFIDDGGVTQAGTVQETKKYLWQGASLGRILRSQAEYAYTFNCAEENAVVAGLQWPGRTPITVGSFTAEVQTLTFTGTGTAGTWTLTSQFGTITGLAYNISGPNLIAAILANWGFTTTITATAGTSYAITFPAALGNVGTLVPNTSGIAGNTGNSVATGTPGVSGTYSQAFGPFTSVNQRSWIIDAVDGNIHHRKYIPIGEAVASGSQSYKADDLTVITFTLNCYTDSAGNWGYDLHDNTALAPGLFV